MVLVPGEQNIPTPERAAQLLADHSSPSEITAPHERPIYSLALAPMAEAGWPTRSELLRLRSVYLYT